MIFHSVLPARAYIDNQGDFAHVPYRLDILEGLVTVSKQLKAKDLQERAANTPTDVVYAVLTHEQTKIYGRKSRLKIWWRHVIYAENQHAPFAARS